MPREAEDPYVKLPPAIKASIARGDQIAANLTGLQIVDGEIVGQPDDPDPPPIEQPTSEPPPRVEEPQEEPPPLAANDVQQQYETLLAQHRTLQGKYNTEIRQLNSMIETLDGKVKALSMQPKVEQPTPLTKPNGHSRVTKEDIDAYGEDLVNLIGRKAEDIAGSIVDTAVAERTKALQSRLDELSGGMRSLEGTNYQVWMRANVEGFDQIDNDPLFFDWLEKVDPFSGVQRKLILGSSINQKDYPRCKRVFEGYVQEQSLIALPNGRDTAVKTGPTAPKVLETLAAPGRTRSRGTPAEREPTPEVFTAEQLTAFYRECARPNCRYSEAEIAEIEKRIQVAVNADRIQRQPRY